MLYYIFHKNGNIVGGICSTNETTMSVADADMLEYEHDSETPLDFDHITIEDNKVRRLTDEEIKARLDERAAAIAAVAYIWQRKEEYPPITDYIDGVVKGDQEQIQAYIDACLAVKAKYPKPEGI